LLADELKQKSAIANQLAAIKKKYGKERKTKLVTAENEPDVDLSVPEENYNVRIVMTRDGFFKKITMRSLQGNDIHTLKEGDEIVFTRDCENISEICFITNTRQMYFTKVSAFSSVKASSLGEFVNTVLKMDAGEKPICAFMLNEIKANSHLIYVFENGKGVRIPLTTYETKSNRRRLTGVYSASSPIVAAIFEDETKDILLETEQSKAILISSKLIPEKATRSAGGVQLVTLKGTQKLVSALPVNDKSAAAGGVRKIKIPAAPAALSASDRKKLFSDS